MIIYAIINTVNGKRYIGMTEQSLAKRWDQHQRCANDGVRTILHAAIRKYGAEAFSAQEIVSLLPGMDRVVLCDLERMLIAQEGTLRPTGYNMTPGGDGLPGGEMNPNLGRRASEAQRARLRASFTPERLAKMAADRAARNSVMNQTEGHKARLRAAWARRPERRAKAAMVMTEVNQRPDRKAAMAANLERNKKNPDFHRAHSEAVQSWWNERKASNG